MPKRRVFLVSLAAGAVAALSGCVVVSPLSSLALSALVGLLRTFTTPERAAREIRAFLEGPSRQ